MGAAARAQPDLGDQLAGPDAGGVDDGAGPDRARLTRAGVGEDRAVPERLADPHPRVHVRAVGGGGPCHCEHEAHVVLELAVPREDPATQARAAYDGSQGQRLRHPDAAGPGQGLAAGARGQPQQVTGADAGAGQPLLDTTDGRCQGHQHRERVHEVGRRGLHQDAALDRTLVGDVELPLGEVAQAAVHQLGAPPARAERDVLGVDGHHAEPAAGGVERHSGPGDAETDHEHVGGLRQPGQADLDPAGRGPWGPGGALSGHGCRNLSTRRASSSSYTATSASRDGAAPSVIVWADRVNPWQASRSDRARTSGSPSRTEPSA